MAHRIRKTIGKLTLAAATRSRIVAGHIPAIQPTLALDGSLLWYCGRPPDARAPAASRRG
jgi:hypothetical protein